jgi:hypothetical protein
MATDYITGDGKRFEGGNSMQDFYAKLNAESHQTDLDRRNSLLQAELTVLREKASEERRRKYDEAFQAFKQGDYNKCISNFTFLLEEGNGVLRYKNALLTYRGMAYQFKGDYKNYDRTQCYPAHDAALSPAKHLADESAAIAARRAALT